MAAWTNVEAGAETTGDREAAVGGVGETGGAGEGGAGEL